MLPEEVVNRIDRIASFLPSDLFAVWDEVISGDRCVGADTPMDIRPMLDRALAKRFSSALEDQVDGIKIDSSSAGSELNDKQLDVDRLSEYLQTAFLIERAASGDVLAGLVLGYVLESVNHLPLAMLVYVNTLARAAVLDFDPGVPNLIRKAEARAGSAMLREPNPAVEIELGVAMLQLAEELDRQHYIDLVGCTLDDSIDLPGAQWLGPPWDVVPEEASRPPELSDKVFDSCEVLLGDHQAMKMAFDQHQVQILKDPDHANDHMIAGFESIQRHAGKAVNPLTLNFFTEGIAISRLIEIMADVGEFDLALDPDFDLGQARILTINMPVGLVLAEVLEAQGLKPLCAGQTLRLEPIPGRIDPGKHLPMLILTYKLAIDPPELAQSSGPGTIAWRPTTLALRYKGTIEAGQPKGRGRLFWEDTEYYIEGYFDGLYVERDVEIHFPDFFQYTGQASRGMAHGAGELTDASRGRLYEGQFTYGLFNGHGFHRLDKDVVYIGEIKGSEPHGDGVCSGSRFLYDCHFEHGRLIRVSGHPFPN